MAEERLLSTQEVMERTGRSRTTIWQLERDGRFPRRRKIGHTNVWLESEITQWMRELPLAESEPDRAA